MPKLTDYYNLSGYSKDDLIQMYLDDVQRMFEAVNELDDFETRKEKYRSWIEKDLETDKKGEYDNANECENGMTVFEIAWDAVYKEARKGSRTFEKRLRKEFKIKKKKKKNIFKKAVKFVEKNAGDLVETAVAVATGDVKTLVNKGVDVAGGLIKKGEKELTQAEKNLKREVENYKGEASDYLDRKTDDYKSEIDKSTGKLKTFYKDAELKYSEQANKLETVQAQKQNPFFETLSNFFSKLFN